MRSEQQLRFGQVTDEVHIYSPSGNQVIFDVNDLAEATGSISAGFKGV